MRGAVSEPTRLDCNEAGLDHLWVSSLVSIDRTYWRCTRCPVSTLVTDQVEEDTTQVWRDGDKRKLEFSARRKPPGRLA